MLIAVPSAPLAQNPMLAVDFLMSNIALIKVIRLFKVAGSGVTPDTGAL